jgi:hypothetical protein
MDSVENPVNSGKQGRMFMIKISAEKTYTLTMQLSYDALKNLMAAVLTWENPGPEPSHPDFLKLRKALETFRRSPDDDFEQHD